MVTLNTRQTSGIRQKNGPSCRQEAVQSVTKAAHHRHDKRRVTSGKKPGGEGTLDRDDAQPESPAFGT